MIAVDTNVLVRLLTGDDPTQEAVARSLFATGPIWIPKTVLLETGWVLGSLFGLSDKDIREAFIKLLGLRNARVEDEEAISRALSLVAEGLELADAIHLGSRPTGIPFVTFDKDFAKRAQKAGVNSISALPSKRDTESAPK